MAEPVPTGKAAGAFSDPDLLKRVVSAVVMAVLAIGTAWWGGWPFALIWAMAGAAILWEWLALARGRLPMAPPVGLGPSVLLFIMVLAFHFWLNGLMAALYVAVAAAMALVLLLLWWQPRDASERKWFLAGLFYALPAALGPIVLRHDAALGFAGMLYLFALVWGTDVAAYFSGRTFGGPKLWPRISPKKTWSGFIGGIIIGTLLAMLIILPFGLRVTLPLVALSVALSALSQGGDLLESAIKRRFDAKDSSRLIPGHGGVMDRLDGFLVAAGAAALFGAVLAQDIGVAATGLLVW